IAYNGVDVCLPYCTEKSECEAAFGPPSTCGFSTTADGYHFKNCADWGSLLELVPLGTKCTDDVDCNMGNEGQGYVCDNGGRGGGARGAATAISTVLRARPAPPPASSGCVSERYFPLSLRERGHRGTCSDAPHAVRSAAISARCQLLRAPRLAASAAACVVA